VRLQEPEEANVITVRVNVGPSAAPAQIGLSHRAYVEAWRTPGGSDTGAFRVERAGNREGVLVSMARLVSSLGRRTVR
jgi:hypothetical protein